MANLIRSAKYTSDWTLHDLKSYNISLNELNALKFFGIQTLPEPLVHSEILNNTNVDNMQQDIHAIRNAEANVCIEDKRLEDVEPGKAQAQLVAEAVMAFYYNNSIREENGLPHLKEVVIPGIVMVGTLPAFFKVPITRTLASHVHHGTYPSDETHVEFCYPPIPHPNTRLIEGMKPLDNRCVIFQCYEAFKAIIGI
ncbi:hypothetical protein BDQ17DRAFT_1384220 [Cyathus striatus]|nr:hypothetical protein BDQ17DRAFT_1384220 [Cyathus striatus]